MKPIAILILSMGMIGSPVLQAQGTGQGTAVPQQGVLVAQAGTETVPPVVAGAPAATPSLLSIVIGLGLVAAGIAAAVNGTTTTAHH